jgi:molybdate transport system substrate-binding protein
MTSPQQTVLRRRALVAWAALLGARGAFAQATPERRLTIAAASDLRFALDEALPAFRAAWTAARIEAVYGASGRLATQIRNGAPFDVFLSADIAFAQQLHEAGLTTAPPRPYAIGRLATWSTDASLGRLPLDALVRDARVRRFAIANPEHAPYGQRAMQALRARRLEDAVKPKLVLGDNVAQAAAFIETGAAQAGLVAHSLVLSPALAGKGAWTLIPQDLHTPLEQALVITRRAADHPLAAAFVRHLEAPATRELLRRFGFELAGTGQRP